MAGDHGPLRVRLAGISPSHTAVKLLPPALARHHMVVPLRLEQDELVVACADPFNRTALREVAAACKRPVRPVQTTYAETRELLDRVENRDPSGVRRLTLGQALYRLGHIDERAREKVELLESRDAMSPWDIARQIRGILDSHLLEAIALCDGLPHIRRETLYPARELATLVPWEVVQENKVIPLWWVSGVLIIGVCEGSDRGKLEEIAKAIGVSIQPALCSPRTWERTCRQIYLAGQGQDRDIQAATAHWMVEKRLLSSHQLQTAHLIQKRTGQSLRAILVTGGVVSKADWRRAVAHVTNTPFERVGVGDRDAGTDPGLRAKIPEALARRLGIVPLRLEEDALVIGMTYPQTPIVKLVQCLAGSRVSVRLLDPDILEAKLLTLYPKNIPQPYQTVPRLGELLVGIDMIMESQLHESLSQSSSRNILLGEQLIQNGYLDENELAEALALQSGFPYARLDHARFDQATLSVVPEQTLLKHTMLPLASNKEAIWLAIADPFDAEGLAEAERASGRRVRPVVAPRSVLLASLQRITGRTVPKEIDPDASILVEKLVHAGVLTHVGATRALHEYAAEGRRLDGAIARVSSLPDDERDESLARVLEIPFVHLHLVEEDVSTVDPLGQLFTKTVARDPVDPAAASLIDHATAKRLCALPIGFQEGKVLAAFADPLYRWAMQQLEAAIDRPILPVLASRHDLEQAIQRTLGKRNLGTALLLAGLITRRQLEDALDYARRTGVRLGRALVNRGYIDWHQLSQFLAEQADLPYCRLQDTPVDENAARLLDPMVARKLGMLPIRRDDSRVTLAIVDPLDEEALAQARTVLGDQIVPVLVSEPDMEQALQRVFRQEYLARSISELLERSPEDSAFRVLGRGQRVGLILFLALSAAWLVLNHQSYLLAINSVFTAFYIAFSAYRFYLVYRALTRHLEVEVTQEEVESLDDRELPVYTLLIPVFREAGVLEDLLNALNRLDYPKTKLDIKVIMEEDDAETLLAFERWNPPSHFQGLIVPHGLPKTKPKACNYGLIHARGEHIVIFDAEDLPDSNQLKKIIVAFSKVGREVVCIQSKLNYYNRTQNLLTRWFTVEYSMWFDLFLPGLDAVGAPIPLGGTSNHFRTEALIEVGAWDPYNVTEDADLGVRLYKRGYKTAVIDSTTYEEANSHILNWIRQRSRWIKGYVQTWLVHMRHPFRLLREMGWKGFVGFQFTVGGTFFAALLNPAYWLLTTLWFWKELPLIKAIFPSVTYYLGAICLFAGNFAFTYMNVAGALRRGYFNMVKDALLSPLYWGLTSIAAWRGFWQLLTQPHFWEKTTHGLHRSRPGAPSEGVGETTSA